MFNSTMSRIVGGTLCGVMFLLLLKYLFDTYSRTSVIVALIATLLVAVTAIIPYLVQRRRCALAAQQDALGSN